MKKITILLVWALLCLNFKIKAQDLKALKLGDKVPEIFWQQEHSVYKNGQIVKQNLSAFKGKLLIIDFWATWCSTCFHKFSFLDSLQKKKSKNLNVLMVNTTKTGDDLSKIKNSISTYSEGKTFSIPTIYDDQYLMSLFPHQMLSHYVWINKLGIVVAYTGSDFVNSTNIELSIARFAKP
ncbi:redoxin domain-containing protein [Pedobacter polaris]|uniref:Redoxin domain-containing protein n=1 Tax=Pedobacter polaris TaxID=2571273 RepID=A0A4U1CR99_9SPHI|nr:TlpA family protein disulfide reductase [Pedobacter polaris]TKC10667.1 redoxin domain-containing protein [Pedobacter polaris]